MNELKDSAQTVNIALDPNLINLHLSLGAKQSKIELEGDNDNLNKDDQSDAGPAKDMDITNDKLILNPYEVYGQMPLPQLIPLILQQRNIPFSQLSEDNLKLDDKKDDENEQNDEDELVLNENIIDTNGIAPGETEMDQNVVDADGDIVMDDNNSNNTTGSSSTRAANDNLILKNAEVVEEETLTLTKFNSIRSELIEQCNIALNESSLALETVSLLLSSTRQENATNYISPFLKRSVPMQSLNSDSIPLITEPISKQIEQLKFTIGWKLTCLDESRNKLRNIYKSMKFDLLQEHSYWDKIMQNITNQDVTFKIKDKSSNAKLLGLKYGYQDSGSNYKYDQGIAMIRNNVDTNQLELVPVNKANNEVETYLRVKIYTKLETEDDYILSGESKIINLHDCAHDDNGDKNSGNHESNTSTNVREQISKLKNVIFDKELIYQLKKECSQLISYGVYIENEKKIIVEMVSEKFEIELIYMDDDALSNQEQDQPKVNDKRANIFLIMLKMLLIVNFKQNLRSKLTIGNILNKNTNKKQECIIIRPILSKLRHQNYKILLKKILNDTVMSNLLNYEMKEGNCTVNENVADMEEEEEEMQDYHIHKLNEEIKMFQNILNPMQTKFIISQMGQESLEVSLQLRNYCQVEIAISYKQFESKFNEFKEVEEFLHFIVSNYMCVESK